MNKQELVSAAADHSGVDRNAVRAVVDALFGEGGVIAAALRGGERVQITGFGTFEVRERAARTGRNPQTGKEIQVPASRAPAFKAGKGLKEGVG
jgi:DNA-binding protein HU-beta